MMSSTSSCLASMSAVCLLRTCFSTYSLPTNIFWLSLQPYLPSSMTQSGVCDSKGREAGSMPCMYLRHRPRETFGSSCADIGHAEHASSILETGGMSTGTPNWSIHVRASIAYLFSSILMTCSSIHSSMSC